MKCFLLYLITLLFLLPAIVFSEENPNPEMELGGNLFLINRDHPIGKDYYPRDLVEPKVLGGGEATRMRPEAAAALEELFAAAKEEGLFLAAVSGYRSYGQQASIFDRKLQKVDRQTAQRTVAPPGCSEHQLGLAMDLGTKKETRLTAAFGETPEGQWVAANAHRFGFIIRYKAEWEEITGYAYEPWHIRYVGKDHARNIFNWNIPLEEYIDRQLTSYVVAEDEGENTQ